MIILAAVLEKMVSFEKKIKDGFNMSSCLLIFHNAYPIESILLVLKTHFLINNGLCIDNIL